jgi:translation initiation factor IF-2
MANLRVYELARELNLENKELLEKIAGMGMDVKSHMASLDEDAIAQIKRGLFGSKDPKQVVEDKRIQPNVIRRRKKLVPVSEEPETPATLEVTASDKQDSAISEFEAPLSEPLPEPLIDDIPPAAAEPEATGIESEPSTEETPEVLSPDTIKATGVMVDAVETPAEEMVGKPATETPEPVEIPQEETPGSEKPVETLVPKRKLKKGTPAKIISLPKAPVAPEKPARPIAPPIEAQAPPKKFVKNGKPVPSVIQPKTPPPPAPAPKEEVGGKKKGKRKKEESPEEVDSLKKPRIIKGGIRRKEVVEGSALYDKSAGRPKKGRKKLKSAPVASGQKTQITTPKAIKRRFKIDDTIVLADLGKRMGIKANELIAKLMGMGMMVTVNQTIDFETACLVATEFGFELERATFEEETMIKTEVDDPSQMRTRPPVVTIMGHVDHGKTSLLDVIRRTKVADFEAGGITQHIGAYHVRHETGEIVFLDTPGHEAFTAMRARGAQVTDIVVLVVAADDGVMPQTIEAIDHAKAAKVPIIVAVNKIDKLGADPERIRRELSDKGLTPEDWGGDTIFVEVSAKQKIGIDSLLEMILLQTEVLELKANPNKPATGHIIESRLDTGRGAVATVLVKDGTLRVGDAVVCGMYYGKIRSMFDDRGNPIKEAPPAIPVEIVGLSGVPMAGDELAVLTTEKDAKQVSEHRLQKQRAKELARTSRLSLEKLYEKLMEGEVKDLNLIIKADVQGSIEALKDSLTKLSISEVKISVIHAAVGTIRESDISLAAVSNAIILGFNVRPTAKVALLAEEENVDIRYYDIIYNAIKEIKDAMVGMMDAKFEEKILGAAEVRETFHVPGIGTIAGSYVTSGKIKRGAQMRLIRDGIVTFNGKIATLRRFKDDVKEVVQNYECGINIENYNDIKVGDVIECYYMEEVKAAIPT